MALLTVQTVNRSGANLTDLDQAADGSGDEWVNTGKEFLYVDNGGGGNITVTLDIEQTVDGQGVTDPTVQVDAGELALIGPFPRDIYNASNGRMSVTYSGVTSVTVVPLILTET